MFTSISQLHSHILDRKNNITNKMLNLKIQKNIYSISKFRNQTSPIAIDHGWIDCWACGGTLKWQAIEDPLQHHLGPRKAQEPRGVRAAMAMTRNPQGSP
jgi:hypothetical protein